ncbi:MAG: hypothetical protein U9N77_15935 [Thermodesulfobacteriota bacterium]|nr:hypothetical protein [Thermodesulfobacteriota bacterium]
MRNLPTMPQSKQAEDLENIFSIINDHPEGTGISFLEETLAQGQDTRFSRGY